MKNRKPLIVIFTFVLLFLSAGVLYFVARNNLSPEDSSALYGGELETGYPSAGFMISYANDKVKTCGYSVIGTNTAITAAHCVDDSQVIYLGQNQFDFNHADQTRVLQAQQKAGWVERTNREDDIAIMNFINAGNYTNFAEIATPTEGCNYKVVAYGRTENSFEDSTKPRKSATICANTVFDKVMYMTGQNSGICFGDSGSPVYYEGTNALVGVVASIIRNDESPNADPCQFGNTAIVVRVDQNQELINNIAQEFDPDSPDIVVNSDLAIQVAAENSVGLSALSLGSLQDINLDSTTWTIGLVVLSFGVLLMLIWLLFQQDSQTRQLQPNQQFAQPETYR